MFFGHRLLQIERRPLDLRENSEMVADSKAHW
jgi:hypothetical protein